MAVTTEDVKQIFETETTDLGPFIVAAEQITARLPSDVNPAEKFEIERWLAAHFADIGLNGGGVERERAGPDEISYRPIRRTGQ